MEEVDITPALSAAALAVKDENELVSDDFCASSHLAWNRSAY